MEAKDITIVDYQKMLDEAREISFKAGIKEVVEWIRDNNKLRGEPWGEDYQEAYGYDPMVEGDVVLDYLSWQARLKEWGIENV